MDRVVSVVVLDTNVFVAAGFNPRSASSRILGAIEDRSLRMIWSDATRGETRAVLKRIPPLSWGAMAPLFRDEDQRPQPTEDRAVAHIVDPTDRKFASLARAEGAILISNDEHLLAAPERIDLLILSPGEFIQESGALGPPGPASAPD
jgi:predicted nucleic acid-binding protein